MGEGEHSIGELRTELNFISRRIHTLKALIEATTDPIEAKKLKKQLKQLQWQALFYMEKIENLKREV